ncbi:hypothetical protein [Sphingomonas japonica]|nr:hypothetical protein [Sphingomonas japonica]
MAEAFCRAPLPDTVAADLVATVPSANRYGTHVMTVAEAREVLRFTFDNANAFPGSEKWASPTLGRAYVAIDNLRHLLCQNSESGIDQSLRNALEALELADCELSQVSA